MGQPARGRDGVHAIRAYSPYDNVVPQAYPHLLATAGLSDPRVGYWEPAKWVAKLRTSKLDSNMLLLKTHMDAGHFGRSGRFDIAARPGRAICVRARLLRPRRLTPCARAGAAATPRDLRNGASGYLAATSRGRAL